MLLDLKIEEYGRLIIVIGNKCRISRVRNERERIKGRNVRIRLLRKSGAK